MNSKQRIDAIDVLRGLALAGMLLVNNPGNWSQVYAPLLHADWHGLTPTDLVFPFFLFVVGAAMAYSFQEQIRQRSFDWLKIYRRTFLLIAIGIFLSAFPYTQPLENWRFPGVLQRIGLCYFLVACLLRFCNTKQLYFIAVCTLLGYWLVLHLYGSSPYSGENNLVRYVDIWVFGESHLYKGLGYAFDPEGLLSTFPAAITTLSGFLITTRLQACNSITKKLSLLIGTGAVCIAIAVVWHFVHPINKSLWTASFVFVSSGIACFILAIIIVCWDKLQLRVGLKALKVYGSNPILLYVLAGLLARILPLIEVEYQGSEMPLKPAVYQMLTQFLPEKLASLSFGLLFMLSFYALAYLLYRKEIFVKL